MDLEIKEVSYEFFSSAFKDDYGSLLSEQVGDGRGGYPTSGDGDGTGKGDGDGMNTTEYSIGSDKFALALQDKGNGLGSSDGCGTISGHSEFNIARASKFENGE